MKGKDIITHVVRAEMPDMEQLRDNSIRQAAEKETVKHSVWGKHLIPIAACLAVVLAAVIAFPYWNNDDSLTSPGTISGAANDSDHDIREMPMLGLPVKNFSLANVKDGDAEMDRIAFTNFGSLFEYGADCFVVVKVNDIREEKGESSNLQVSNASVLKTVYGAYHEKTVEITQYIYKNHFCLGTTNLLRKGGVYLLPLTQSGGTWYTMGDMDVLFEADETGKVWSHSAFEDFNRYDGTSMESFIHALQTMFSDDDFLLANSPFAGILRSWTLADISVSEKSEIKTDPYGNRYYEQAFTVHEILSNPSRGSSAPLGETGMLTIYLDEADPIHLLPGNRYLLFLDSYEGKIETRSRMIAKVGDDETITVMPAPDDRSYLGASVFTPYDGYQIASFRDMVSRINLWRESHK